MFPGDLFQITWELPPRRGDVLCRQRLHATCGAFVCAAFQQSSCREWDMTLCRSCSTVGTAAFDDQFAALLPRSVRLGVGGGCMIGGVQAVGALPCASDPSARASRTLLLPASRSPDSTGTHGRLFGTGSRPLPTGALGMAEADRLRQVGQSGKARWQGTSAFSATTCTPASCPASKSRLPSASLFSTA